MPKYPKKSVRLVDNTGNIWGEGIFTEARVRSLIKSYNKAGIYLMNATENKCVCEHEYESGCACCTNECSHWWACAVCDEYFDPAQGNFVRDDIYTGFVFVCNGCES